MDQKTKQAQKEENKKPEISYEQLLLTLKDKTNQIKKQEKLQKKLEERFKEKNKQIKELNKEKLVFESFFNGIFAKNNKEFADSIFDKKETKAILVDSETLLKAHNEIYEIIKP